MGDCNNPYINKKLRNISIVKPSSSQQLAYKGFFQPKRILAIWKRPTHLFALTGLARPTAFPKYRSPKRGPHLPNLTGLQAIEAAMPPPGQSPWILARKDYAVPRFALFQSKDGRTEFFFYGYFPQLPQLFPSEWPGPPANGRQGRWKAR
jgi:hypothetical protein